MPLSNYTHQGLLNSLLGKTSNLGALASAPTVWVGMSTTEPTMAGGNVTEPSGGAYGRAETAASDWGTATDADPSVLVNSEDIEFAQATATWVSGNDLAWGVCYDAEENGNFLGYGQLGTAKPVTEDDTAVIPAGSLEIEIGSPA